MSISFDNPTALWLLVLVPAFYVVGRFGIAYLPRAVRNAAIAVRLLLVTALILAIAQPVLHRASDLLSVVFVVDRSASTSVGDVSIAPDWVARAIAQAGPNDRVGIVDFAGNAVLRRPLGANQDRPATPRPAAQESNLGAALHLASSLFPNEGANRIIVLSDGQTNAGDAAAEARQASTRRAQIDVVPMGPPPGFQEVLVDSLTVPPDVRYGQSFDVGAIVHSTIDSETTLRFAMDGKQVSEGKVTVHPGLNRFSINLTLTDKGFHSFSASIEDPHDTYAENNQAFAFTDVNDAGKVAVVAADGSEAASITAALQSAKIEVSTFAPSAIPPTLSAMRQFDAMVVVNTPASAFSLDQLKTIAGFAHDLGRGLLVIGGAESYGQGKYDGTPLGDALPVESGVPGNVDNGNVALVLVIDKSGSMDENEGGVRKMAMANKAAQLAIGLLAPTDQIGVEAFDTEGTWAVPLQQVGSEAHRSQVQALVGRISASGGTDIFEAMKRAYDAIHLSDARYKHIILMSDGNSLTDSNYNELLQHIQDEKITLSTIAIGSDSDKKLMSMLAQRGGGQYYYTDDASKIPEITTRETKVVRGSAKVDATFRPQIVAPSPLLGSFSGSSLPLLNGYVVATPKQNTTVALQSDRKDPILVHWNYGLGRVVAWMSDLSTPWGANWIAWSDFDRFWSQAINWSMRPAGDPDLQMSSTVNGSVVNFRVDVVNEQGAFQDLLDLRARVPGADGKTVEVPLIQTRPGRYEADFSMSKPGAYPIEIVQYQGSQVVRDETTGIVVSYPPEYRDFGINEESLASIAALTGGKALQDPADAFDREGIDFAGQDSAPIWPWLLALVALLLPIDVAIRRLRVDPLDLSRRGWGGGRRALGHASGWLGQLAAGLGQRLRRAGGVRT